MISVNHLTQGFSEIPYQRAADAPGVHLPDLDAGFFEEPGVYADLPEFIFDQYDLLSFECF